MTPTTPTTRTTALVFTGMVLALTTIAACEKKQATAAAPAAQQSAAQGTATARQRWPEFLEAFTKATDHSTFKVKAAVPTKAGETVAWINVQSVVGTSVAGPLLENAGDIKKGERVTVTADKVRDWAYTAGGKSVGDFTRPPEDPSAAPDAKAKGK